MIARALAEWLKDQDPQRMRQGVYLMQAALGFAALAGVAWLRGKGRESGFRVREAELRKKVPGFHAADQLGQARLGGKPAPLRLTGIRIDGTPHEILGVAAGASVAEIQKAYRELMKRYHPDIVARPGTAQWTEAQRIAEAINRAKEEMLARVKARG